MSGARAFVPRFAALVLCVIAAGVACDRDPNGTDATAGGGGAAGSGGSGGSGGSPASCGALPAPTGSSTFDDLVAWADAWRVEQDIHGMAIAVIEGGGEPLVAGLGVRERGTCDPVTERTLFRSYFPSQRAAALAALVLAEDGELDLDAPLVDLVPELSFAGPYSDPARPVRVRHALTESVGSRPGFIIPSDLGTVCPAGGSLEAYFSGWEVDTLRFFPGDTFSGSGNLDFLMLGLVVQRAAGTTTYAEAVKSRVLDGLEDVAFDAMEVAARDHVAVVDPPETCDAAAPVGGLHIGTADLARFYRAMTAHDIVSEATMQVAYEGTPSLAPSGPVGWPVQGITLPDGERLLIDVSLWNLVGLEGAEGDVPQSCVLVAPDRSFVVAVQMLLSEKRFFLGPCAEALERFTGVEIEPFDYRIADFAEYEGLYTNEVSGRTFEITSPDPASLLLDSFDGEIDELAPDMSPAYYSDTAIPSSVEADIFCGAAVGCLRFERDGAGAVLGISLDDGMAYRSD